ncbi:PmoA family protein [Nonomuraea sp. NPDC050663]|uniref:PmoA family protein n=1 Tax=Nonomuraea sp. NPDC050663 TaxID=3364370 RepID=UPI0037A8CAFC
MTSEVLQVNGREVATYVWQPKAPASSSPRPYLHPVRTLAGRTVTDAVPDSHPHQFGIGVAFPDIDGVNFWGGRTFVSGHGPAWLDNHGSQRHERWLGRKDGSLSHSVRWLGPDEETLLQERRVITSAPVNGAVWSLAVRSVLTNVADRPLVVRSSASKGRVGAGYGGFFWRGPDVGGAGVFSPSGSGVEPVHGRRADWVAVAGADWTVVFRSEEPGGGTWFVRARDYLGVGSCVSWDEPKVLRPLETIDINVVALLADGVLGAADVDRLLS